MLVEQLSSMGLVILDGHRPLRVKLAKSRLNGGQDLDLLIHFWFHLAIATEHSLPGNILAHFVQYPVFACTRSRQLVWIHQILTFLKAELR